MEFRIGTRPVRTQFGLVLATAMFAFATTADAQATGPASAKLAVKPKARIAFVGDSITWQKGYTRFVELYLRACTPELDVKAMQFGIPGEQAAQFLQRMDRDLVPYRPDVVTICYGMNDGGYAAMSQTVAMHYTAAEKEIISRLKAMGVTAVVGSPGAVDTKYYAGKSTPPDVYNNTLKELATIARNEATSAGMPFANIHDPMVAVMKKAKAAYGEDYDVCGKDGVHPGNNGHLIMAHAFLKAMGFKGDLGTITVDMKGGAAAANGHKVLSGKNGTAEIESSRYPFCFPGGETEPGSLRSIVKFVPFNPDLNRLTLVVRNLSKPKANVQWGGATKSFDRAKLEKGINLAEEFLDNPFCGPMALVEGAIFMRQEVDPVLMQQHISGYPGVPNQVALPTLSERDAWEKWTKLDDGIKAAVKPVRHTITITEQ